MSQVIQIQAARIRAKVATRIKIGPIPPLMAERAGPRSYTDVVRQPAKAWRPKPTQIDPMAPLESKSELIQRKLREIQTRSTAAKPICHKCGCVGHLARSCRNALLCFVCNRFSHKSRGCSAITSFFPPTPPPKTPAHKPRSFDQWRERLFQHKTRLPVSMAAPLRTPIITLTPTPESELIEREFALSFILDDIAGWGPDKVEQLLQSRFKRSDHRWIATVYAEFQYLIKAPTKTWLDSVISEGYLTLRGVEFSVLAWEPDFDDGMDLTPIWIRVTGFPKTHWSWAEVEKVFNPLGAHLLEIDPGTGSRYDWRFARLKIGVCDIKLIPPIHYVEYLNLAGKIRVFDLHIELESANTESVYAWRARLNGRPYPNGTEFGIQPDQDEDLLDSSAVGAIVDGDTEMNGNAEDSGKSANAPPPPVAAQPTGTPPAGCRTGSGIPRKRDEGDDGGAGSGKKPRSGARTTAKSGGSGSKSGNGSGSNSGSGSGSKSGTGSRPGGSGKPMKTAFHSPVRLVSSLHSPTLSNSFQLLSDLPNEDTEPVADSDKEPKVLQFKSLTAQKEKELYQRGTAHGDPAKKQKLTWGQKKKQSPITHMKKNVTWSRARHTRAVKQGVGGRLCSATPKSVLVEGVIVTSGETLTTPEVADTASTQLVQRKSLRVQAQNGPNSTMSKMKKRIRDKEVGNSNNAGHMDKRIKAAAEEWLPREINAIPLRIWDPADTHMVLFQELADAGPMDSPLLLLEAAPGTLEEDEWAAPPAIRLG